MYSYGNSSGKKSPIGEKIETFQKLSVIKDYYLIMRGGKIGTDFLQYARKNGFPFVLVIDRDEHAHASRSGGNQTKNTSVSSPIPVRGLYGCFCGHKRLVL